MLSASEEGGYTELIFERPRDTNDSNDIQFEVSKNQGQRAGINKPFICLFICFPGIKWQSECLKLFS